MFKARGTKIIIDDMPVAAVIDADVACPVVAPVLALDADVDVPDHVETADFAPDLAWNTPNGNLPSSVPLYGTGPAMAALEEQRADNAEDAAELAAMMGMTMPVLPPDFATIARAARAGDVTAITTCREIGEKVPTHMRLAFAEMVHGMLEAD
jgi:hypothetical protein